jgi:acyl-CoA synthetase (AMP-forming)/AMP-acid ligase II
MSESYSCGTSDKPLLGCTVGQLLNSIAAKFPDNDALVAFQQNPYGKAVLNASIYTSAHEALVSDEPNSYREPYTIAPASLSTPVLRYTWKEFLNEVNNLAKGLMMLGVERGMRVAIWALNYAEWILVQFATAKIGAVMVNINPAYRTFELEYALKQSEVDTLILQGKFKTSDYVGMFYEACPEAFECRPGSIRSEKFPYLRNVVFMGEIIYNGMYRWSEMIEMGRMISDSELADREDSVEFDDALNIQYTSGTTGYPKGVTLSHHSVLNNGLIIGDGMAFTENDKLCIPVPFYHCFGMVLSNMACVTHGTTMVIPCPAFDAEAVLYAIEAEKCTAVHGVPTMFIAELEHPNFDKYDLSSLRTGIMAGSPCPIEKMRELLEYDDEVSAVEIRLAEGTDGKVLKNLQKEISERLGPDFKVKDRFQQNESLYKMMKYEKAAIYMILIFVIIIIAFNIFGSLSMLIIEKKFDIGTLRSMGAQESLIKRIFILEGWFISLAGLAAGLLVGTGFSLLQQHFGFIKMPGHFVVQAYPVILSWSDVLITTVGVATVGYIIATLPIFSNRRSLSN